MRLKRTIKQRQSDVKAQITDFERRHPEVKLYRECEQHGYFNRLGSITIIPYNGRYGIGYKMELPSWTSSRHHTIRYYIKNK